MATTSIWMAACLIVGVLQSVKAAPNRQTHKDMREWTADERIRLVDQAILKSTREIVSENVNVVEWNSHFSESEVKNVWANSKSELRIRKQELNILHKFVSSLVTEIIDFHKNHQVGRRADFNFFGLTCDACEAVISLAQYLISSNTSEDDIKSSVEAMCTSFAIETPRVCKGIIDAFAPELLTVLTNLVALPSEICGIMFDGCGGSNPFDNWNVTFPPTPQPPPVQPVLPKQGSPTLRVLHLTDLHYDPEYQIGSNANCGEPLCCRDHTDTPVAAADAAGKFGDYRNCDTPMWTLEDMFVKLAAQNDTFDYIIWTGDIPAHNVWNQSRADQLNVISQIVNLFLKYFPGKPVYPSLGNHESAPVNSFPPPYITGENAITWLYEALANNWKHWLPQDAVDSVRRAAYYTVSPYPGFRVISLNMNYCNDQNWWMLLNTTDPTGELAWLIEILQKAEDANEKVHILGHIPPGNDCLKSWSWNYYKIVNRYQNTITGQFFGHTHKDQFVVFYDAETLQTPVSVAYIGPSVTTYSGMNMGYRFYTIDGSYTNSSYQVLDHETFFLNLTKANTEGKTTWELEYSAKTMYNLTSLFPRDWDKVATAMRTNNTLVQIYNKLMFKSVNSGDCDAECRLGILCQVRSGRSHDPSLCKNVFKRDEDYVNMLRREVKHC